MDELHKLITELTCGDDQRAESVVPQLVSMGGNAIDVLIPLLGDSRSDTRWWALRVLAEISDSRIPPLLTQSLTDIDPEVRQCATLALRLQPDPQAVPRLISSLSDEDAILAYLAADALVAIGDPAIPSLLDVLDDGSPFVRLHAVRALAMIGNLSSIPALFKALDDESAMIEYWAHEGLERMGVGMAFFKP